MVANDGHDKAKNIDNNVVAVIDEEDMDRWEASVKEAVHHHGAFHKNYTHPQVSFAIPSQVDR